MAFIVFFLLLLIPFLEYRFIRRTGGPFKEDTEIASKSIFQSVYNVMFTARRAVFVLILSSMESHASIQLQMIVFLNMSSTMYLAANMPFVSKTDNRFEIMNECTLMLITYCFMFFLQSLEANATIGSVFIWIYIINISLNGLRLGYNFCVDTVYSSYK